MRHLRSALLVVLAIGLALAASAAPAAAGSTRVLTIATEDVTNNGWNGIDVQQYEIAVADDGSCKGRGKYLGFVVTNDRKSAGRDVRCGLTQSIEGKVGDAATFVARYDAPESAYWYDFNGKIDGTSVKGTGRNVNGQRFEIRNATEKELKAARASC